MKKTLFIGLALVAGAAFAQMQNPSAKNPDPANQPSAADKPGATAMPDYKSDTSKATLGKELSGELKSIDKDKHSLTIAPLLGASQDVKVADNATITRDGTSVGFDQLKSGDQVRASFDPSTNQATSLEVTSKSSKTMK